MPGDSGSDQSGGRAERGRTKKLTVAFHFQFANQAGWKCEECRKQGLEAKRRCGWLPGALATARRVVWARRSVSTEVCPKSLITAESVAWLEAYYVWKKLGGPRVEEMSARQVQAFLLLERELAAEASAGGTSRPPRDGVAQ